jgi:hypothetical protein
LYARATAPTTRGNRDYGAYPLNAAADHSALTAAQISPEMGGFPETPGIEEFLFGAARQTEPTFTHKMPESR